MSELTKGPWKAKRLANYQEPGWVVLWPDKGGTHMRRLDYQGNFTGPDAALIAAAPELLAAAKKVNALSIQTDAHKELRAAISKATGTADAAPECTCAAKDMTFGRCCKVTPNA